MERINISELSKAYEEPRGYSTKYWVTSPTKRLIKYNDVTSPDADVMESLAATILNSLHIDSVNARLGINTNGSQIDSLGITDPNCCIIDSFLVDDADVTISLTHNKWARTSANDEQKNIDRCFYRVFSIFGNLMGISENEIAMMKGQYIRMVFGDCIIDNEDRRLKNIEAIYNERRFCYRLAPSFDNALAFNAFNIGSNEGYCYIGNQEFPAYSIIDYIMQHHYPIVDDVVQNLDYLASQGIESILLEYSNEIAPDKSEFIYDYVKSTNEKVQSCMPFNAHKKRR